MITKELIYNEMKKHEDDDRRNLYMLYTSPSGSHCFVGQILTDLGIELPEVGMYENGVKFHSKLISEEIEPAAVDLLQTIQSVADKNHSWCEVVEIIAPMVEGNLL